MKNEAEDITSGHCPRIGGGCSEIGAGSGDIKRGPSWIPDGDGTH